MYFIITIVGWKGRIRPLWIGSGFWCEAGLVRGNPGLAAVAAHVKTCHTFSIHLLTILLPLLITFEDTFIRRKRPEMCRVHSCERTHTQKIIRWLLMSCRSTSNKVWPERDQLESIWLLVVALCEENVTWCLVGVVYIPPSYGERTFNQVRTTL